MVARPYIRPKGATSRLRPGTVVELRLDSGEFGYIQYVCPGWFAPVIRVCPGVYDEPLEETELRRLVARPALFMTQFGLDREVGPRRGRVVGVLPIPPGEATIPPFRMAAYPADYERAWVKMPDGSHPRGPAFAARHPDVDFDALPLWDIPFAGTLSWMIETQWTPKLARGEKLNLPDRPTPVNSQPDPPPANTKRRTHTTHLATFEREDDARHAAEALREAGDKLVDVQEDETLVGVEWLLRVVRRGRPDIDFEESFAAMVRDHNGTFEGNLVGPFG